MYCMFFREDWKPSKYLLIGKRVSLNILSNATVSRNTMQPGKSEISLSM